MYIANSIFSLSSLPLMHIFEYRASIKALLLIFSLLLFTLKITQKSPSFDKAFSPSERKVLIFDCLILSLYPNVLYLDH